MKRKIIVKVLILAILLTLLLPYTLSCASPAVRASSMSLTGYIMDTHCFLKKPDPALDSKKCLLMSACAATGYGIAVKQEDNTYKFYVFDGDFAPAATGSQVLAFNLANETEKNDHISISVTCTQSGNTIKSADGTEFPVINVTSMSEYNE